jgi:hypothetical protein
MTLERFALDYSSCTIEELRQFCLDRLGSAPVRDASKEDIIHHLHQADKEAQFPRFTELPAELRNRVYQELLMVERSRYKRDHLWPQILSVSKQLYAEAEDVLYADNEFEIFITEQYYRGGCDYHFGYWGDILPDKRRLSSSVPQSNSSRDPRPGL